MGHAVVWFDLPVNDLDRAIRFYSAVMGKPVKKETFENYSFGLFQHEQDDVAGCLTPGHGEIENKPSATGPLMYFNCAGRLDEAIAAVVPNGGKILKGKESIGPYGFRAIILDSEGNRIALHSC